MVELLQGDCLELLSTIPDHSVDLVLTDPPYGVTRNEWDVPLPMDIIWPELWRCGKENAAVLLFCQMPYLVDLFNSQRDAYRYDYVCCKSRVTGFLNAAKMPLKRHEHIFVFYRNLPKYNPQFSKKTPYERKRKPSQKTKNYGNYTSTNTESDGRRYPCDVIESELWPIGGGENHHQTEKPVPLLEYMIRTYTDPGDTVLDFPMGSGSTGVAAVRQGRNFIGIERDPDYFAIAQKRLDEAQALKEFEDAQITIGGI